MRYLVLRDCFIGGKLLTAGDVCEVDGEVSPATLRLAPGQDSKPKPKPGVAAPAVDPSQMPVPSAEAGFDAPPVLPPEPLVQPTLETGAEAPLVTSAPAGDAAASLIADMLS